MRRRSEPSPGITAAQYHSFAKKMPAYYVSFVTMMVAVSFVFWPPLAPAWMSIGVPAASIVLSIWRAIWWTRHRNDIVSDEAAGQQLRRSTIMLLVVALVITSLDLKLFTYGGVHARYFILIQLIASAMCGFYCLMHLRAAALVVFVAVLFPFSFLAFSMHQPDLTAAAVNCVLTAGVMVITMRGYRRDFLHLVQARTEMVQLNEENLKLARLDMLTGLPNRRHFFEALERSDLLVSEGGFAAVGIIDLDGFKPVNDTYGHRIGDLVLEEIASRLRAVPGDVRHLCRVGGDEFAFLTGVADSAVLLALGHTIQEAVSQPLQIEGRTTSVGCCVGFSVRKSASAQDATPLYEQADYALYHSKRTGRARTTLFSDEHQTEIRKQGLVEQTLRNADLEAEFYPLFQPIVDLHTARSVAFECLARWTSPTLGEVSPGIFIPVAEHSGLITELTPILLRKALRIASTWPDHIHLAFNVSPYDIGSLEKTRRIISIIQESGVAPHRIAIELTETALLQSFAETKANMAMIRSIGATISLDDFGTGHSSLSYIHSLPLDRIKVDRSFTKDVDTNPASANIVRSLITLCRNLKISCVIEGVETKEQLCVLEEMDGKLIQGFYFSRPMPADQVSSFLRAQIGSTSAVLPAEHEAMFTPRHVFGHTPQKAESCHLLSEASA